MTEYIVGTDGHEGHWLTGEEIVRCRNCDEFAVNIHGSYCKKSITTLSDPNGFCAWGKRRAQIREWGNCGDEDLREWGNCGDEDLREWGDPQ